MRLAGPSVGVSAPEMGAINNAHMNLTFESALDWSRRHPLGASVTLTRSDGSFVTTRMRSWAAQWGSFAVLCESRSLVSTNPGSS